MPEGLFANSLRLPPANLEAEQALLGALLANPRAYDKVGGFLLPKHFADPLHERIFAAIQRRVEAGQVADAVTLRADFAIEDVEIGGERIAGSAYLARLLSAMVGIINAGDYGRTIHDTWLRRELIAIGEDAVNLAHGAEPDLDARGILARVDESLLGLADRTGAGALRDGHQVGQALMASLDAAIASDGGLAGATYGLRGLDRMTGGMRDTHLILIAGRPSMGKTAMARAVAIGAARAGKRGLFVSAEMQSHDVLAFAACGEAGLPISAYTRGGVEDREAPNGWRRITSDERLRIGHAAAELARLPIAWDDESVTVQAIRARARQMMRAKGPGLDFIVVDYLGRLRASERAQKFGRVEIVTEISNGLKAMAKELGVPVVVLSQLSRDVEKRDDKTPNLADLRDSGALEQDADVVIFLYREHYYLIRNKPVRRDREKKDDYALRCDEWRERVRATQGRAIAIVAKQRMGAIGPVRLRFSDTAAQFSDDNTPEDGGE
jgi:replicative DNA helicase